MSDYGSYLSHHPRKSGLNQLASKFRTYQQDKTLYGKDADFIVYISLPDELAAHKYIKDYKSFDSYWGPYNNCADSVTNSLNSGFLGLSDLSHGWLDFISYPEELERELRGIYWTPKTILRDTP